MELAAIIKYSITLFTFLFIGLISFSYLLYKIKNKSGRKRSIILSENPANVNNNLKFKVISNLDGR